MHSNPLCCLSLFLLCCAGAAQDPLVAGVDAAVTAGREHAEDRVPIHTAAADQGASYGVWAAGRHYKASFHDGATFVPYLGRGYPRSQSLRWVTTSVRIGATELCSKAPTLRYDGFRAEYDLGGLIEAWDVRDDGLEQTFVIDRRPAGDGDLVVQGAISTALRLRPGVTPEGGLVFVDEQDQPIIGYGAATAIDANGRTRPMTTVAADGSITLRLDAAWLEQAAFPLTVDPLIGMLYGINGDQLGAVDMLRDSGGNTRNVWLVSERWASAVDADLQLRRIEDDGSAATLVFTDLTASWSAVGPSLGVHQGAATTMLAFTRRFAVSNTARLRFHQHDRGDLSLQTGVQAIDTGDRNAWAPDVASDLYVLGARHLVVVFQRDQPGAFWDSPITAIYGVTIDLTAGTAGVPFAIADDPAQDHARPTIGKVTFTNQVWPVAWQTIGNHANNPHVEWDIRLRRVDRFGNLSGSTTLNIGNTLHEMAPQIGGTGNTLWLVYTSASTAVVGARPGSATGQSVFARRYDWNGTGFTLHTQATVVNTNLDARVELCGIDVDRGTGSHALLTYRSTVTQHVYWALLGYRAAVVSSGMVFQAPAGEGSVPGAVAYDDDQDRFLLGYGRNLPAIATSRIDLWQHPAQPATTLTGLGCSPAPLAWIGTRLIGDQGSALRLSNLAPGALCTVLIGTGTINTPLIGVPPVQSNCWLLVPNAGPQSLGFLPPAVGPTATWTMDLPERLDPMLFHCQGVHFDATNTTVLTTQRLSIELVR